MGSHSGSADNKSILTPLASVLQHKVMWSEAGTTLRRCYNNLFKLHETFLGKKYGN